MGVSLEDGSPGFPGYEEGNERCAWGGAALLLLEGRIIP
jgi:hypothetical protein